MRYFTRFTDLHYPAFLDLFVPGRFPGDSRTMYGMRANLLKIKDELFRAARKF